MANIPIRDIPVSGTPGPSSEIVFDDGQMKKGTVSSMADAVRPVATQNEAQVGADNTKTMTPARVKDSIGAEINVTIASKEQGDLAGSALQPAAIGNTVQVHSDNLDVYAFKTPPAGDVVGTSDAQTLTNKTLTAPAITAPTGIIKADVGLGNVDNTSDADKPVSIAQMSALDLKADKTTTITAGTGLDGGGDLSSSRSIALSPASILSLGKADTAIQPGDLGSAAYESASAFAPVAAGVPPGGTTGQALVKKSAADRDYGWADPTGGGGGISADVLTFYGTLALEQAEDRLTGPVAAGTGGNGIFDGFNVLTYVDVAGATNLDTSKPGVLRPSLSDTTVGQTATPSAGTVNIGGVTLVDRGYSLPNNATVKQIKLYSTATVTTKLKVVRRNSAGNYDVVYSQSFAHPGGGWATMTLDTFYPVPSTGTYHIALFYAASQTIQTYTSSGPRAAFTGDATGDGVTLNETNGQVYASAAVLAAAGDGMTVASTSFPMNNTPEWARLLVFVELKGAVIGTGLLFDASSDGAVWQEIPMTKLYDRAGGAAVLSGQVALSDVPGLDGRWRVRTSGGSLPEILAIGLMMGRTDA